MKFKHLITVLFVFAVLAFPMASAQEANNEETVPVQEKIHEQLRTAQYFKDNLGAQIRVEQLHRQVLGNHAGGDLIITYIKEHIPEANTSELVRIQEELDALAFETQTISLETTTKEEALVQFQAIREEAKELSNQFREQVHEIVPEEEREALREEVQKRVQEKVQEKKEEMKNKVEERNKERMLEILQELPLESEEIQKGLREGYMDVSQARKQLGNEISAMNQQAKKNLKNRAGEVRAQAQIAHQKMMNGVDAQEIQAFRNQVQERIDILQQNNPGTGLGMGNN